jgi:hypothetical protein
MMVELGRLGYGAADVGNLYRAMSDDDARAVLEAAWESGVRYGGSSSITSASRPSPAPPGSAGAPRWTTSPRARTLEVLARDERHAGVLVLELLVLPDRLHGRLDAVLAHSGACRQMVAPTCAR